MQNCRWFMKKQLEIYEKSIKCTGNDVNVGYSNICFAHLI